MNTFQKLTTMAVLRALLVSAAFASPVYAATEVTAVKAHLPADDAARIIQPGMTAQQVLAKMGAPERKVRFTRTGTTAWDYSLTDTWGYFTEFSVILDDNDVVVSRIAVRKDS